MADYKDPRPSPTASAADPCVIYDNAISFNNVLNTDTTVTTYTGKELLTLSQAVDKFGFGVALFTFAVGGTLESLNLLVSNSPIDGFLYKYVGTGSAPIVVTAGTDPTISADWQAFTATSHELLSDLNAVGGHDAIYSRNFKTIANLKAGIDATGQTIDMSLLAGFKVFWRGYYAESDGGSNWGIVKLGAHTDDGGSIFSIDANTYVEANIVKKSGLVSVRKFGGKSKGEDAAYDIAIIINQMLDDEIRIRIPEGVWSVKTPISYTKFASINSYYSSVPPETFPTVVIHGQHKDNTILESNADSFAGVDYLMQINTNPDNVSSDAYMFNPELKNFTIRGTGAASTQHGLKIRGWWHGNVKRVKVHRCLNGIYVDGKGTVGSDDHDTVSFTTFENVSLINNNDSGFKAIKTRPSGIAFNNCELRANGKFGYHGGMASVTFNGGSITLNGSAENEGGLYVTKPESGSIPRGLNVNGTTFESNYNFEIWIGYLNSGSINHPIFTPFENPSWTSTTKSIIKILETATTTNEARFSLTGARINAWSTTGQAINFVRSNSNFGKVRVKENGTQWNGNITQVNMVRYVFGSLDVKGYKSDINQTITLPTDGGSIANITAGTNLFNNSSALITAVAIVDDGDSFAYSGGSFRCIKPGFYTITVVLPVGSLSSPHAGGYTLDIRVSGVQVASVSRLLPLSNGQYDVPFSLTTRAYLELNEAPTFFCRIEGSDATPVTLKKNGIYEFSVIES